ncbi:MAG: hypothetical protein DRI57_24355 [Deltaproteobacteria bacterium]|nr:MAG: hypothetical protein DRI57_24355 [Deltaproteobacteria bacterium]
MEKDSWQGFPSFVKRQNPAAHSSPFPLQQDILRPGMASEISEIRMNAFLKSVRNTLNQNCLLCYLK